MGLKLLVTSDFHADEQLKDAAIEEANSGDYDIFLNLGDFMTEEYAEELFEPIEIPALGCTGNRDMHFSSEFMDGPVPVYNFLEADIDDEYLLILIGGDFPEDIKQKVDDLLQDRDGSKVIIGSHYPPKKLGDRVHSGERVGFDQYRELLIKHKPALWASGHIHEDFGRNSLFDTEFINAAGEETGKAYSVTIGDEGGVEDIEEIQLVEK
ncbi:metallophosphoesterase family protein [Candidatus Nanosalina sp. VS9-1]|uniref:metallophosphoesterase family protein n=1 Tax=Candidatus Nanosalina sp. VS9-1 TaxID=3388566 RepID=UPI0039E1C28C